MKTRVRLLEQLSLLTIFLVVTVFAPRFWDPTVFPKVAIATVLGAILLVLALINIIESPIKETRLLLAFLASLITLGFLSTWFSDDLYTGFFGISPRSNGFFGFHAALAFLVIGTAIQNRGYLLKLLWLLAMLSFGESLLGLAQDQGFQLIAAKNLYSPILGTFGNPNFLSAFLGFGLISSLFLVLDTKKLSIRLFLLLNIALGIIVILKSQSIQGLFMFGVGLTILCSRWALIHGTPSILAWVSLLIVTIPITVAGLLGRGPLGSLLYQDSTFYRFDYWRIAIRTMLDRPFLGVGPDQFAYSYITYRDAESMSRETNIVVDSAHNMFLQIGATFGLPYLATLIVLVLWLSALAAKRFLLTRSEVSLSQLGVVALWSGFLVQTTISVDTISALVPGFFLGGLLLGQLGTRQNQAQTKSRQIKKSVISPKIQNLLVGSAFFSSLLTLYPPYNMFNVTSEIRDNFSAPGTSLNLDEINDRLWASMVIGNGDRYLWSRIANFRYGSQDVETARLILEQSRGFFPNYPTIMDFQAQLAVSEDRPLDALTIRKQIYSVDKMNILNIREILALTRQLEDRITFNSFYAIGLAVSASFFSDIETDW